MNDDERENMTLLLQSFWKEERNEELFSMIICIRCVGVINIVIMEDVRWSRLWMNVWKKMLIERYMDLLPSVKRFLKYLNYCYLVIVLDINLGQVKYLGIFCLVFAIYSSFFLNECVCLFFFIFGNY